MSAPPSRLRWVVTVVLAVATLVSAFLVSTRLRLDPNVGSLLPDRGEAAALRRYLRAFGGSDLGVVLVTSKDPEQARTVADSLAERLSALPSVEVAAAGLPTDGEALDPMLAWRHADAATRSRLAEALTPEAMRTRLRGTRAMLLAPGSGAASEDLARDPLRLVQLLAEGRERVGAGVSTTEDGAFSNPDGTVRLVLVRPRGQALRGDDARAFVVEARALLAEYERDYPGVELGLTGGHAIAEATEHMLMQDMTLSGTLSMLLASLAFVLTFRRVRALLAVMPPVVLGTLWTAAVASSLPSGLSAISVAFMSVVIGVGVDTGVHVYAALLEARQAGLEPAAAARRARAQTQRPVLVAAFTAGAAFAALALSEIGALRQLGILCAGGEVLTAIAIVVVTPEIGARLERGAPPAYRPPRWTDAAHWLTRTRARALLLAAAALAPMLLLVSGYTPVLADAIVAMRPKGLEPLHVQEQVYEAFGGRPGQWVILVADPDLSEAQARADRIAERLAAMPEDVDSLDALTALAPAPATQRARFDARDALDMPAMADRLEAALADVELPGAFTAAVAGMRDPPRTLLDLDRLREGPASIMLTRYLGFDAPDHMVVLYLHPRQEAAAEARVEAAVREADPAAMITGYGRLEGALRASLVRDMPRIGLVAGVLVLLALGVALRRPRDVVLAALVVVAEIGAVLVLVRWLDVPLHAYDALVLPVLLGITVDEGMFLLHRAREVGDGSLDGQIHETLRREGPPVATTALTTAAGFAGLILCDFDGLRHLGMVGALGSVVGLAVALIVVPAGLRLARGGHSAQAPPS